MFRPFVARAGALFAALAALFSPATAKELTLQHGPFEIVLHERRISSGTWPNQGGSPFATVPVSSFSVRWQGREVTVPRRGNRAWAVLRLLDAPRPALLLVNQDFTLITERDGALQVQALSSASASLAEAQWLDSEAGQPGPSMTWGIEKADLHQDTQLRGGRWLRLGSSLVLDVQQLVLHKVEPWVPMRPGVPITSLSRQGDEVRAFSPGRTQYVLAGSQYNYATGRGQVHGLLVVDIAAGRAYELRADRRRMPFADHLDMDAGWIAHYFAWQRGADGRETLVPRTDAPRRAWRGRLLPIRHGVVAYRVARLPPAFLDVVHRIALQQPGAGGPPVGQDPKRFDSGVLVRIGSCELRLWAQAGSDNEDDEDRSNVDIFDPHEHPATREACRAAVVQLGAAVDAELASGRHDALIDLR
jgi:hypothetical protein